MDWTAFAPDFQALQKNVEYIEREDEFDVVVDCDQDAETKRLFDLDSLEAQTIVDVVNIGKVPAFDSDSEDEDDLFYFEPGDSTRQ
jgi:COMPASS component SWD1